MATSKPTAGQMERRDRAERRQEEADAGAGLTGGPA